MEHQKPSLRLRPVKSRAVLRERHAILGERAGRRQPLAGRRTRPSGHGFGLHLAHQFAHGRVVRILLRQLLHQFLGFLHIALPHRAMSFVLPEQRLESVERARGIPPQFERHA